MDLRIWVFSAIVLSLMTDSLDLPSSSLIIIVLIVQMTLSMDGLKLSLKDMRENRRDAVNSLLLSYGLNTVVTLAVGYAFIPMDVSIWYGWVILASMPCAIAVVTATTLTNENMKASFVGVSASYLAGLLVAPILSFLIIGDAVNPLEILRYIVLFILLPLALSRPLGRLALPRTVKVPIINLMMFIMIFLSVNSNHGFIMEAPEKVLTVFSFVIVRLLVLILLIKVLIGVLRIPDDRVTTMKVMGLWKNTGLSVSMSMLILSSTPESVVPCFLSLMVECVWFSFVTRKGRRDDTSPDLSVDTV